MALISYLTTIRFGCGVLSEIPEDLDALRARRPLVVTDKGVVAAGLIERLFAVMPAGMPQLVFDDVPSNPTEEAAHAALARYRDQSCDGLVALGGGSPVDLAKAVALLAVDEVEPGKLAAESGLAIVLQGANHGNEANALDSLREPSYSTVMRITRIARYTPVVTLFLAAAPRLRS